MRDIFKNLPKDFTQTVYFDWCNSTRNSLQAYVSYDVTLLQHTGWPKK